MYTQSCRKTRIISFGLLAVLILLTGHSVRALEEDVKLDLPEKITLFQPYVFNEIWGYLLKGEEHIPSGQEPLTDLCYFGCSVGWAGQLSTVPSPPVVRQGQLSQARTHLVIADLSNAALMRAVLNPSSAARTQLVRNIATASARYNGIQIDFEAIPPADRNNYSSFLQQLKTALGPDKILSVALPARRALINDGYDYKNIGLIVDRVLIMAYDQHWSTSKPGPVASLAWCREVVSYATSTIPQDRLIMGMPLYGRVWQIGARSRSVRTGQLSQVLSISGINNLYSPEDGHRLTYTDRTEITIYVDDIVSQREKLSLYHQNVNAVGFWRLGQEDQDLWKHIAAKNVDRPMTIAESANSDTGKKDSSVSN